MVYDLRIYTFMPGTQSAWLEMYDTQAHPIQAKYLGKPVAFMVTEVGPLNQALVLWAYESLAEYETKRNAMKADPAWQAYVKSSGEAGYTQSQESRILRSASLASVAA